MLTQGKLGRKWYWARGSGFQKVSSHRRESLMLLWQRQWFINTVAHVQDELLSLPKQFDPFLRDMAERPEISGHRRLIRLQSLAQAKYSVIPVFYIETTLPNGKTIRHTYEFQSWAQGSKAGSKGLVLLRNSEGVISHIICLKQHRFATAREEFEGVGGFADPGETGDQCFIRECEEELGVSLSYFEHETLDLGELSPDAGMSCSMTDLRALIIDGTPTELLGTRKSNTDLLEGDAKILAIPIEKVFDVAQGSNDSSFLSALMRLAARGAIALPAPIHRKFNKVA